MCSVSSSWLYKWKSIFFLIFICNPESSVLSFKDKALATAWEHLVPVLVRLAGCAAVWTENSGWLKLRWKLGGGGDGSSDDQSLRCGDVRVQEARWIIERHYQETSSRRLKLRPASSLLRLEGEEPSTPRVENVRRVEMWWWTQIKTAIPAVVWPNVPAVTQTRNLDAMLTAPHPTCPILISLLLRPNAFTIPLISTSSTTLNKTKSSFGWTVKDSHLIFLPPCWLPSFLCPILQPEGLFLKTSMIMLQPFHGSEDKVAVLMSMVELPCILLQLCLLPGASSWCSPITLVFRQSPCSPHCTISFDCVCLDLEHSSFLLFSTWCLLILQIRGREHQGNYPWSLWSVQLSTLILGSQRTPWISPLWYLTHLEFHI